MTGPGDRAVGLAVAGVAAALAAITPAAQAATVSVTEGDPTPLVGAKTTILAVDASADGSKANAISLEILGTETSSVRYRISDTSGGLMPGPGCEGGGTAVECLVPVAKRPSGCNDTPICADPGQFVNFSFTLGDGGDTLSSEGLAADTGAVVVSVTGGGGDDVIDTGPTPDSIEPGSGADTVRSRDGGDTVSASPGSADGADALDLGTGFDSVSYSTATVPVTLDLDGVADDGPAGDGDNIVAAEKLTGGAGDDVLAGLDTDDRLDGGPGNDTLLGGGGFDYLEGSDGADEITAGPGPDAAFGGAGRDVVAGSGGGDLLIGALGSDTLRGGAGADALEAGYGKSLERTRDRLDCGAGVDTAFVGPKDRTKRCEKLKQERAT